MQLIAAPSRQPIVLSMIQMEVRKAMAIFLD
jgi:hypothetical protein